MAKIIRFVTHLLCLTFLLCSCMSTLVYSTNKADNGPTNNSNNNTRACSHKEEERAVGAANKGSMKLSEEHLGKIREYLPTPRKPPKDTLSFLNAVLYAVENGGKWRALPEEFGNWHNVYVRFNRWSKNGTLLAVFTGLQQESIIEIDTAIRFLDSMTSCVHPDGTGALKSSGPQSIGRSKGGSPVRFIWCPHPPRLR